MATHSSRTRYARRLLPLLLLALLATLITAACGQRPAQYGKVGEPSVTIAVGGKTLLAYLPLTLAGRLGYFEREGVNVELNDRTSGATALRAMLAGDVDVVSGYYDHTIQMQPQDKDLVAFVEMMRYPGTVLAVSPRASTRIRSVADLKGRTVGVTAVGSSSYFFLKQQLRAHGMRQDAVRVRGIGGDATAVIAMERGYVSAAVMVDPAVSQLEARGGVRVLADTRTGPGLRAAMGVDSYPAAVLYTDRRWLDANPDTANRIATAIVDTLRWIRGHSAEEIAARMPYGYDGGDPEVYIRAIDRLKQAYSTDGTVDPEGAAAVLGVLEGVIPSVRTGSVDLSRTYTDRLLP
jgi:NitT/TauT family transport system substrate-binding protein